MHRCESFRESIIETVFEAGSGGAELSAEARRELDGCPGCLAFHDEARAAVGRFSRGVTARGEPDAEFLAAFDVRLRRRIINDRVLSGPPLRARERRWWLLKPLAPALALMVLVVIVFDAVRSRPAVPAMPDLSNRQLIMEPVLDLDPLTVDFLERSELFLRSFVKIGLADTEDIEESQQESRRQLPGLEQRREALIDFPPVLMVIDEYEEVLRDIRNLPAELREEDLMDIQERIRRNGLVGRMKAYQPTATLVAVEN